MRRDSFSRFLSAYTLHLARRGPFISSAQRERFWSALLSVIGRPV